MGEFQIDRSLRELKSYVLATAQRGVQDALSVFFRIDLAA
jgi:hypothetical protein